MKIRNPRLTAACCIALIAAGTCEASSASLRTIRRQIAEKDYKGAAAALEDELPRLRGRDLQQGNLLLASIQTDMPSARRILASVVRSGEPRESLEARLELAKIAYALGDYGEVVDLLADVRAAGRGNQRYDAVYIRGMARKLRGEVEQARADFISIDRGEYLYWSYISLAELDMQAGRFEEAVKRLETVAGSHSSPMAGFRLGECYEILGESEKAVTAYRTLAATFPESPEAPKAREKVSMIGSSGARGRRDRREEGGEERKTVTIEGPGQQVTQKYTLQFGAFSDGENARALVAELAGSIEGIHIETSRSGGTTWHRVRAGLYATREEAEEAAVRIMEQTGYSSRVLPVQ
jgi:tetratricopeptide (TPR) repeat protein